MKPRRRAAVPVLVCFALSAAMLGRAIWFPRWGLLDDGSDIKASVDLAGAETPAEFRDVLFGRDITRSAPTYIGLFATLFELSGGAPLPRVLLNFAALWATLLVIFRVARRLSGRALAGYVGIAAFATAPCVAENYLTLGKPDVLTTLFWLLAMSSWIGLVEQAGERLSLFRYLLPVIWVILAAGTRETGIATPLALLLFSGIQCVRRDKTPITRSAGGTALVLGILGVLLVALLRIFSAYVLPDAEGSGRATSDAYVSGYQLAPSVLGQNLAWYAQRTVPMWIWVLPLFLWLLFEPRPESRRERLSIGALALWALCSIGVFLPWPLPDTRYLVLAAAPLSILLGMAVVSRPESLRGYAWIGLVWASAAWGFFHGALRTYSETVARSDLDRVGIVAIEYLAERAGEDSVVILYSPYTEREVQLQVLMREIYARDDLYFVVSPDMNVAFHRGQVLTGDAFQAEITPRVIASGAWVLTVLGEGTEEFSRMLDSPHHHTGEAPRHPPDYARLRAGLRERLGPVLRTARVFERERQLPLPAPDSPERLFAFPSLVDMRHSFEIFRVDPLQ